LKKTREIVPVLMNLAAEKESVANVLFITRGWVSFLVVCSHSKWRELTTARLKNLLKLIN